MEGILHTLDSPKWRYAVPQFRRFFAEHKETHRAVLEKIDFYRSLCGYHAPDLEDAVHLLKLGAAFDWRHEGTVTIFQRPVRNGNSSSVRGLDEYFPLGTEKRRQLEDLARSFDARFGTR